MIRVLRLVRGGLLTLATAVLLAVFITSFVYASQSSSTNYAVDEAFFGAGGELNTCSTSYCSKQAAGEAGAGRSSSTNYAAQSGFNTFRAPSLTFIVNGGSTDLGTLSPLATTRTTATFSVKTYLASGYVVQTVSDPPSTAGTGSHQLAALAAPTAAVVGAEQFGINLVANTSPVYGADPVQVPDSSFGFGTAAAGYNTPNLFKYVKGDAIAQSARSSGETDYTVSYMYNVGGQTQAGEYVFTHVLVATATY